jgi:glycosyltransferase involved in cell wall biosynthesis
MKRTEPAKRVLQIAHGHPHFFPGGTELTALALHRQALKSGLDSWYLGAHGEPRFQTAQGARMLALSPDNREAALFAPRFVWFGLEQDDHFEFLREFRCYLEHLRPDVVHFHHVINFGLEAVHMVRNVLPDARVVLTLHDYYLICANNGQLYKQASKERCAGPELHACMKCLPDRSANEFAMRALNIRNALSLCDRLVSPSHFLKQTFDRVLGNGDRITVVENGYVGSPVETTAHRSRGGRPLRFGYFGNIAAVKGLGDLLDAAELLAADEELDFRLNVHGAQLIEDTALHRRMQEASETLGKRVHFCGSYKADEMPQLLADIDCMVFPSFWWENAPLVIYEALYHSKQVIAYPHGGAPEILKRYSAGIFAERSEPQALAAAMQRVIDNPRLAEVKADPPVPARAELLEAYSEVYFS